MQKGASKSNQIIDSLWLNCSKVQSFYYTRIGLTDNQSWVLCYHLAFFGKVKIRDVSSQVKSILFKIAQYHWLQILRLMQNCVHKSQVSLQILLVSGFHAAWKWQMEPFITEPKLSIHCTALKTLLGKTLCSYGSLPTQAKGTQLQS